MQRKFNPHAKSNLITGEVISFIIIITIALLLIYGGITFLFPFEISIFLLGVFSSVYFYCTYIQNSMVIRVSKLGITVTGKKGNLFSRNWNEIKEFGEITRTKYTTDKELIFFSTEPLSAFEKKAIIFNKSITEKMFYCPNDEKLLRYVMAQCSSSPAKEDCFVFNINNRKLNIMEMFFCLTVSFLLFTLFSVLFILCWVMAFYYIETAMLFTILFLFAVDFLFLILFLKLKNKYNKKLTYNGKKIIILRNGSQEVLHEFDMEVIKQIGVVGQDKNKYIFFSDKYILNVNKRTVLRLYKKGENNLVYCDYNEEFYRYLRTRYSEKIKI